MLFLACTRVIVVIVFAAHAAFHPVFLQSCLVFQESILATTIWIVENFAARSSTFSCTGKLGLEFVVALYFLMVRDFKQSPVLSWCVQRFFPSHKRLAALALPLFFGYRKGDTNPRRFGVCVARAPSVFSYAGFPCPCSLPLHNNCFVKP